MKEVRKVLLQLGLGDKVGHHELARAALSFVSEMVGDPAATPSFYPNPTAKDVKSMHFRNPATEGGAEVNWPGWFAHRHSGAWR